MFDATSLSVLSLTLSLLLAMPILLVAALVGLLVAVVQASSQVQDPTLAHLPRLLAVAAALALTGPRIGQELVSFAQRCFSGG